MRIAALLVLAIATASCAFAGTQTLWLDQQSTPFTNGSGFVTFNSYSASSISISVNASVSCASQQGGGRNYSGYAEAVIGTSNQKQDIKNGSDPIQISVSNSLTVTKGTDGVWRDASGNNMGSGVTVSAYARAEGENGVGPGFSSCVVSWVAAPQQYSLTVNVVGSGSATGAGVYNAGTVVTATATPAAGNYLEKWSDDASGAAASTTVTMNSNKTVTANFKPFQILPVDASISVSPASATAPGSTTVKWTSTNTEDGSVTVTGSGLNSTLKNSTETIGSLPAGSYTYTITATNLNGSVTRTATFTVTAPPANVSAAISANPTNTNAPGSSTITWSSSAATSVSVSGPGLNSTATSGSQTVIGLAAGTHTYTITALGNGGSATQSVTVTVAAPSIVTASITADPTTAGSPGSSTISWTSTNATSVSVIGPGISSSATDGSQSVANLSAGTYTYTITAQGNGGPVTRTATVTISAAAVPVSAAISTNPTSGTAPASTTVTWSSTNATSVSVTGPGVTSSSTGGTQTVTGLTAGTHTFTITAEGEGGPVVKTASVTVTASPIVSAAISVNPTSASAPATANVTWNTSNAVSVSVSGYGLSTTSTSGSQTIYNLPQGTYTYTIAVEGSGGPITRTATIVVGNATGVTGQIDVSPTSMAAPGNTTVTWSTTNATAVSVSGTGVNSTSTSGSVPVSGLPEGSYSYRLTAQGASGPVTRTATFTVEPESSNVSAGIGVSPTTLVSPNTATLTWTSTNATSVNVYSDVLPWTSTATSGSQTFSSLPAGTYNFYIKAYGPGGPVTKSAALAVNWPTGPGGRALSLGATPKASPWQGGNVTLYGDSNLSGSGVITIYKRQFTTTTTYDMVGYDDDGNEVYEWVPHTTETRKYLASWSVGIGAGIGINFTSWNAPMNTDVSSPAYYSANLYGTDGKGGTGWVEFEVARCTGTIYTLTMAASGNGTVSGAGSYIAGTVVTVTGSPSTGYQFDHWSGDATGTSSVTTVTMDGNKSVTGYFISSSFTLTTAASGPGSVTAGGTYSPGTFVTVTATPNASGRFTGWSGDASGTSNPLSVQMTSNKSIVANFSTLLDQTITFPNPGNQPVGTAVPLTATASSGLAVTYTIVSGSATLSGSTLTVTAAGDVTIRADQLGNASYAPASPVTITFNGYAPATVTVNPNAPTVRVQNESDRGPGQIR